MIYPRPILHTDPIPEPLPHPGPDYDSTEHDWYGENEPSVRVAVSGGREANADRLGHAAGSFFDPSAGEAAWWLIAGDMRQWLRVRASVERTHAFYDSITGRGIVSGMAGRPDGLTDFTPAG